MNKVGVSLSGWGNDGLVERMPFTCNGSRTVSVQSGEKSGLSGRFGHGLESRQAV